MKYIIIIFLSILSFAKGADESISIGTFNIEWLGDGIDDQKIRTEEDYKQIARVIKETNADILGLQEIENKQAINKVLNYLKEYKAEILENGSKQNIGIIYKKNIKINSVVEYKPLETEKHRTRPGLIVSVKKGNFDFILMIVHLKSTSSQDRTNKDKESSYQIRLKQTQVLNNWIDSVLLKKEQDIMIVGDFNDHILKPNTQLGILGSNKKISFITEKTKSCLNGKWYTIDNILISKNARKRYRLNSLKTEYYKSYIEKKYWDGISDHCPITAEFDITLPDDD